MKLLLRVARIVFSGIFLFLLGLEFVQAITGGLISGNAAGLTSISNYRMFNDTVTGYVGGLFTGGGTSINVPFYDQLAQSGAGWGTQPYNPNNVILQTTGHQNVLRNQSFASWDHYKFVTKDTPSSSYTLGIASFTATISNGIGGAGTQLAISSPTGAPALFQRVTDGITKNTTATTGIPLASNPTCTSDPTSCVLTLNNTTGIVVGMYVTDTTTPRAISGHVTVSAVNSPGANQVTLSGPVGFSDNTWPVNGNKYVAPGVGGSDNIVFSRVIRGTEIVGCPLSGGTPNCGAAGTYTVNIAQNVPSETMQSAGGWPVEGLYMIPVGTPGSSSISCGYQDYTTWLGARAFVQCTATGTLTDLIIRYPVDSLDAARIDCLLNAGAINECVTTDTLIQPVTLQFNLIYGASITSTPTILTKTPCSVAQFNNSCIDNWQNATADLATTSIGPLPQCFYVASEVGCVYAYTFIPTGVPGGYEVEFHLNGLTNGQLMRIQGAELKQTPGATCSGSKPPCFQLNPGFLEIDETGADIRHNARFAQLIGSGYGQLWNGSLGPAESTQGFAYSTTQFIASWPLATSMRCDVWVTQHTAPTCPRPNVYFDNIVDYIFTVAGGTQFVPTNLSVLNYGKDSLQLIATTTGMTAGTPGYVTWGATRNDSMILLDSSIIGD